MTSISTSFFPSANPDALFPRWRKYIAFITAIAVALTIVGTWQAPAVTLPAYFAAVLWIWSISIGSLGLALMFHLTGGRWGEIARPWFSASARVLPLLILAFLPLSLSLERFYPWTNSTYFTEIPNSEHRQFYLSIPFFLGRGLAYFLIWTALIIAICGAPYRKLISVQPVVGQATAGLSAVALLLTVTWASIDWLMSPQPEFASTIFGALIAFSSLLSGLCNAVFLTVLSTTRYASSSTVPSRILSPTIASSFGSLLLAFLLLWAYVHFSQFLLIWSGNLPAEAKFYLSRIRGAGQGLTLFLTSGGFVPPLILLVLKPIRSSKVGIMSVAAWMLLLQLFHFAWFLWPSFKPSSVYHWIWTIPPPVAVGGTWIIAVFTDANRISAQAGIDSHAEST